MNDNVIMFPNVKEESSDFVETDKVRVWNTIYQIPVKVKIPITAESDDEEMIRQIFISLCEYYRFDHANTDHKTNPDNNATIFIFSINGFLLPPGVIKHLYRNFKCKYNIYATLLDLMAHEYEWPIIGDTED